MRNIIQLTFFLWCLNIVFSQSDTLVFYNGKLMYNLQVTRVDSVNIEFLKDNQRFVNSQGRMKPKLISRSAVFEIIYADGNHQILYSQDSIENLEDTNEIKSYIEGARFARENFHNYLIGPAVFGITLAGFILDISPIYTLSIPGLVALILAYTVPYFPKKYLSEGMNKYYILGYQDIARSKLVKNVILWGGSAFVVDLILNFVLM
ncbi:MAG: hypothetical protein N2Z72_01685 [Bacteroidales bacterium]|nr:hypothetical protein [Bacteroidales bacterium]